VHASGIPRSTTWITLERAMSCRVYSPIDADSDDDGESSA